MPMRGPAPKLFVSEEPGSSDSDGWQELSFAGTLEAYVAFTNDLCAVLVREVEKDTLHLSFHRHDRAAIRDWRHIQAIKNEIAGPERFAFEVFPPESMLLDSSNEYHLWVLPPGCEAAFPYIWPERFVLEPDELEEFLGGPSKARQRPWEPGIPTGNGHTEKDTGRHEPSGLSSRQSGQTLEMRPASYMTSPSFLVLRRISKGGNRMIGLNSMIAALALYVPGGARKRLQSLTGERGQAFVEYVLLITVIAIAVFAVAAWTSLGTSITNAVNAVGTKIGNP